MPEPLAGLAAAGPPLEPVAMREQAAGREIADDEGIARLRALGYVGGSEPARAPAAAGDSTRTAGSYGNEGLILEEHGRREDARRAYERALAVDPGHAASLWNLSRLTRDEALVERALAAGSPDAAQAVLARARARLQAGDCRGALEDVRAVEAAQPSSPIPPAAEALALLCLDDKAAAAAALKRSLAIDPDQPALREMVDALARDLR
jgi:tetratricopeptide (TPR) repeat protein